MIKTIDISALGKSNLNEEEKVAFLIREACESVGFFRITDHGISPALLEELRKRSFAFFSLPHNEKLNLAPHKWNPNNPNVYRGYFPSSVNGKEGYDMGSPAFTKSLPDSQFHEATKFPSDDLLPGWRDFVERYYEAMQDLGIRLLRGFSLALDLPVNYFNDEISIAESLSTFRLNYYPPESKPVALGDDGEPLCCEMHTDGGLLTILYQPDVGGLEVRIPQTGKWEQIPPSFDSFVINTGLFFEKWSNGRFHAAYHRVKFSPSERISVPFFFEPDAQTRMRKLPSCSDQFKYEEETYAEHLTESNKRFVEYAR